MVRFGETSHFYGQSRGASMLPSRFREICFNQLVISLRSLQTFEAIFITDEKFDFTPNETFSMQFTKINENFESV